MKSLTFGQAAACENSTSRRCRCRCRGAYHGVGRGELGGTLPAADRHPVDLRHAEPAAGRQLTLFDLQEAETTPTPAPIELIPVAAGRNIDPGQLELFSSGRTHLERARQALAGTLRADPTSNRLPGAQRARDVLERRLAAASERAS